MICACPACGRTAELSTITSALDSRERELCITCMLHNAEPVAVVVNTVNWEGWKTIPSGIRASVRIFDLEEYVPIGEWARRVSQRQLAPYQDRDALDAAESDEAEALLAQIMTNLDRTSRKIETRRKAARAPRRSILSLVAEPIKAIVTVISSIYWSFTHA